MREEHPYQGTASYFRNVQRQHMPHPPVPASLVSAGDASASAHHQRQQQQQEAGEPGSSGGGSEGWTLVEGGEAAAAAGAAAPAGPGAAPGVRPAQQGQGQHQQGAGQPPSGEELSQMVAVTCINLLHANPKKASELMLSSHFQDVRCAALLHSSPRCCRCCHRAAGCSRPFCSVYCILTRTPQWCSSVCMLISLGLSAAVLQAMRHVRRRLGGEAPIKVLRRAFPDCGLGIDVRPGSCLPQPACVPQFGFT